MSEKIAELVRGLVTDGRIVPPEKGPAEIKELVRELVAEGRILPAAAPEPRRRRPCPPPEPPPESKACVTREEMDCYHAVLAHLCAIHPPPQRRWPKNVLHKLVEKLRSREQRVERMRLIEAWAERKRVRRAAASRQTSNRSLLPQFSGGVS